MEFFGIIGFFSYNTIIINIDILVFSFCNKFWGNIFNNVESHICI